MPKQIEKPAPPAENGSAFWQNVISEISAKKKVSLDRVRQITDLKSSLSLRAHLGEEDSIKRIFSLNDENRKLAADIEQLQSAGVGAQQKLADATAAEQAEADRARQARCSQIAARAIGAAAEVDESIKALAASCDRFKSLVYELGQDIGEMPRFNMLFSKFHYDAAGRLHGLRQHFELSTERSASERMTFADAARGHLDRWLPEEK